MCLTCPPHVRIIITHHYLVQVGPQGDDKIRPEGAPENYVFRSDHNEFQSETSANPEGGRGEVHDEHINSVEHDMIYDQPEDPLDEDESDEDEPAYLSGLPTAVDEESKSEALTGICRGVSDWNDVITLLAINGLTAINDPPEITPQTLLDKLVLTKWDFESWQVGKVFRVVNKRNKNYEVLYPEGDRYAQSLQLSSRTGQQLYRGEPDAPVGSWLLLRRVDGSG